MRYLKQIALQQFNFIDQNANFGLELEILFPHINLFNKFTDEFNKNIIDKEAILDTDVSISRQDRSWEVKMPPSTISEIQAHPIWKLLNKFKAYADSSCGVHISIPINYFTREQWETIRDYWNNKLQDCEKAVDITGRMTNFYCAPRKENSKESAIYIDEFRAEFRSMAGSASFETVRQYIYNIIVTINNALNQKSLPYMKVDKRGYNIRIENIIMALLRNSKIINNFLQKLNTNPKEMPQFIFSSIDIDEIYLLEISYELTEMMNAFKRFRDAYLVKNREGVIDELHTLIGFLDKAVKKLDYIDKGGLAKSQPGGQFMQANRKFKFLRKI